MDKAIVVNPLRIAIMVEGGQLVRIAGPFIPPHYPLAIKIKLERVAAAYGPARKVMALLVSHGPAKFPLQSLDKRAAWNLHRA